MAARYRKPEEAPAQVVSARVAGFVNHLRLNGFPLGPRETETALAVLAGSAALDAAQSRLRLKTALCGRRDEWDQFDALFEAYWFARGRQRSEAPGPKIKNAYSPARPKLWDQVLPPADSSDTGEQQSAVAGDDDSETGGAQGHLLASRQSALARTDLRHIVDAEEIAAAEALALKLARAIRFNLSRRRKAVPHGDRIDLRRTIRRSLARGGEPIDLVERIRPARPVRIVVLLDVSGSMKQYSRFFLQFVKGLIGQWLEAEAFLFHTRLVKVSGVLRDQDSFRAMTRLALMAQGFGGGTRIGESLRIFNDHHAASALNSRSVVVILSDGYDTDAPDRLVQELTRLRKRARRIVWLNPLLGWQGYEPVARAMAAALPLVDCFAPASTLEELAAIESQLSRL